MTPKKIYIHNESFEGMPDIGMSYVAAKKDSPLQTDKYLPYILESEHNRIVDELKAEIEKLKTELIALKIEFGI
jgi:hypothetical protein